MLLPSVVRRAERAMRHVDWGQRIPDAGVRDYIRQLLKITICHFI
jgi:hypothetical protein